MTYSPNMTVIRRIARAASLPRPRYDVDRHGIPVTEDTEDKKPRGFLGGMPGRIVGGMPRACQSCGVKYPWGPLCGGCWKLVKDIDAQAVRPDIIVEVPSDA